MTDNAIVCLERCLVLSLLCFCQSVPVVEPVLEVPVSVPVEILIPGMTDLMGTFLIKS